MRNNEFVYWLNGYFELTPLIMPHDFNSRVEIIRNHIALTETIEGKLNGFPAWLSGYLDRGWCEQSDILRIRGKLEELFKHEIDPGYEGDPKVLQSIHDGGGPSHVPGGTVFRC